MGASGLDAAIGTRFAFLGATFRRPPPLAVDRVARVGVVRTAGRSLVDWARGLWGAPGAAAEQAGSQLTAPLHVASAWRRGGPAEAKRVLQAELAGQARRVETLAAGVEVLGERARRFTPGTAPLVIAADVRRLGGAGALDRHVYETFQVLPDVALAAAGGSIASARRLAAAEQLAETSWIRSAPNAAQAARLTEDLAAAERVGQFWVTGRVDPGLLRELSVRGVTHDPSAVVRAGRRWDGRVVFLERGDAQSGWRHIVTEHGDQFAQRGLVADDLADAVIRAPATPPVSWQRTRPVHLLIVGDRIVRIAVTVGENGYIVGANVA